MALFDMHCHLAFLPAGEEEARCRFVDGFLNCTVTPGEFAVARERFAADERICTAVGLHPWYVPADPADALRAADAVCELITPHAPIGEVGLDFGPRHASTRDAQVAAFSRIATRAAEAGGCVLSLHSVQATSTVLDILDESGFFASGGNAIFHWYSGSSDHLQRALRAGALFSVNPRMLLTKRGREYARIIPSGRLLTETDLPAEDGTQPDAFSPVLAQLVQDMAELRQVEAALLADVIESNARGIFASVRGKDIP